jgi:transposase-like protein
MGNVSMVARTLNVDRTTVYNFMKKHPTVKAKLDEAREKMIDNVESKLYSKALDGDTTAMIFFLKTQGKHRGYVERQEVTGAEGSHIVVRLVDDDSD